MQVSGVPYDVDLPPKEGNGMVQPLFKSFKFVMEYDDGDNAVGEYPVKMYVEKDFSVEDTTSWPAILREFCDFMASCYGYDIREKIVLDTYVESEYFRWLPTEVETQGD